MNGSFITAWEMLTGSQVFEDDSIELAEELKQLIQPYLLMKRMGMKVSLTDSRGYYVDASPQRLAVMGYTLDQIRGKHWRNYVLSDIPDDAECFFKPGERHSQPLNMRIATGYSVRVWIDAFCLPNNWIIGVMRSLDEVVEIPHILGTDHLVHPAQLER